MIWFYADVNKKVNCVWVWTVVLQLLLQTFDYNVFECEFQKRMKLISPLISGMTSKSDTNHVDNRQCCFKSKRIQFPANHELKLPEFGKLENNMGI